MASWTDPSWLEEVHEWVHAEIERHGAEVVGAIEQPHVRPWSTVLRVPITDGNIWFKANMRELAHEAGIVKIFVRDGGYLFFDWGDACVSHPFFTMAVTLEGVIGWGLDDVEGSEDPTPYRDAYLQPFTAFAGRPELEIAHAIALRLGWLCRALNVHRYASALESPHREEHLSGVGTRLRLFAAGLV